MSYQLLCMGNPLLDMQVTNAEAVLEKYNLKADDAILADESQAPIYDDLVLNHKVTYVAGGAAQNAARGAAYVLPPHSVAFAGCVGDDELAEQLKAANKKEDVESAYLVKKGELTGACAVVITGHHRSLVTTLRSAEKFEPSHLETIKSIVDGAKMFYVEGYFLTHGVESTLQLAKRAANASKIFAINLSAPFIPQFFKAQLDQVLPYADIVIGNESEAAAYASAQGLPENSPLSDIAKSIAALPKNNGSRSRVVIITNGSKETILVKSDEVEKVRTYDVKPLKDEEIVDTNAAGDAFAGGFVGAQLLGKDLDDSVRVGQRLASMCIGQSGPQFKWPKENIL